MENQFKWTGLTVVVRGKVGTVLLNGVGPNPPLRVVFNGKFGGKSLLWVPFDDAEFTFLAEGI